MAKFIYKNISGNPQVLMGVGEVEADKTVEVDEPINNPNFELQSRKTEAKLVPVPKKKGSK